VLFALDGADERQLLSFADPRALVSWVANTVEERWDADWLHEIDKMWFPVHYCLHGAADFPVSGTAAEAKAVFGGQALGVPNLYRIDYKNRDLVGLIASALARMRDDAVRARAGLVDRKDYTGPQPYDLKVSVVDEIRALAAFYRKAADADRAVIFTVDM
jgi:hypothetical protein